MTNSSSNTALLLLATAALGIALAVSEWLASPLGLWLTALSLVLVVVAMSWRPPARTADQLRSFEPYIGAATMAVFFLLLWRGVPHTRLPYNVHAILVVAAGALIVWAFRPRSSLTRWPFVALAGVFAAIACWRIVSTPAPPIDVWVWHREALDALFAGRNPYAMTMPNIYGPTSYYAPELVDGDRVLVGYQYPPLSLYLAIPGYLLGDYRYSLVISSALAGLGLLAGRPARTAAVAATLWFSSQASIFVIQFGWTDTFVVMFLVLTVVAAFRGSRWTFVALGLFFASKQYAILAVPLIFLLPAPADDSTFRARLRLLIRALAVAMAVTLPFLLWDPVALFRNLVTFQVLQPFRPESLSLAGWLVTGTGANQLPAWLGFATILPTTALALWRGRRDASGFATALALVFLAFFFCSKPAFVNYYIVVFGALAAAVAFSDSRNNS